MSANPPVAFDAIEIVSIFTALKKSARSLVAAAVMLSGVTFGVLSMMAPKYQSEAELAIVARGAASGFNDLKAASAGPDTISTKMDKEAINTHVRALQSPDLMGKIAEDLDLKSKSEFNAALGPVDAIDAMMRTIGIGGPLSGESERDRVLKAFRSQLEVYSAKESRFIGVRTTSSDPQLAADIANKLAETYRASLASQGVTEIDDQQKVLQGKIDKLVPEVAASETEIDRYRGQINVFTGGAQNTGLNEQQLSELTAELTKAKASRGEADARARSAREMMKLGSADALPDVQKSPLIQNLVQQRVRIERQISELSATLLPGHPRMRQLNADLAGLKLQLNAEISKTVDSLDKEARIAQGREDSIKKSLDDIKSRVVSNAPEEAKLRQLEANVKAKRNELENLQGQLESNRKKLDARAQPVEAQLISRAQAASVPVFPKKTQLSVLVGLASLLFGTAWSITRALFNVVRAAPASARERRAAPRAADARKEPVLAATPAPELALDSRSTAPHSVEPPMTIAKLSQRLADIRPRDGGGYRTLITGESATVDSAAEAIELVKMVASRGAQAVLVEWSLSGAVNIAERLELKARPGLTELLAGEATFNEIIKGLPGSSAHVVTCGAAMTGVENDLDSDHLNMVLDALDEAYEHIIITGSHDDCRLLFEAIQGRFDTGILICEPQSNSPHAANAPDMFLGLEVAELDVVRIMRPAAIATSPQRMGRAASRTPTQIRARAS